MAYPRKRKWANHDYKDDSDAIEYTLKEAPLKAKGALKAGDTRSACVQMVRRKPLSSKQVCQIVAQNNHHINEHTVEYVLHFVRDVVASALRQGIGVNLADFISIKPAFEGRVDPNRPYDVKHVPIVAKATFNAAFTERLNKGVMIHYAKGIRPTEVKVTEIQKIAPDMHRALGAFHNIQSLTVELIEGDCITPCRLGLFATGQNKHNHGTALTLLHEGHVPTSPYSFRFTWLSPTGSEQTLTLN